MGGKREEQRKLKMCILSKIKEQKDVLFGPFSTKVTKDIRSNAWRNIGAYAQSLGIIKENKNWAYVRDVWWANVRKLSVEYYGCRLKGIHILNAPYYIDKIIYLLKGVLKPKIAARIHVHKSYEDMHEFIPKEVLPKDYGGYEDTCSELSDKWRVLLGSEDAQRKISELEKAVPDESKRQNFMYEFNKEYTCMSGTFKKLELD